MPDKNQEMLNTLKEMEATIEKIMGLLSKRASHGYVVNPSELEMAFSLSKSAKTLHGLIEEHKS